MKNEQTNDRCWTLVPIQEKKQIEAETVLEIPVLTESSAALVRKLLPSSQSTGLMRAVLDLTR